MSPISEKGEELLVCQSHRLLGNIYVLQGEEKKAIHHFKTALGIATRFDRHHHLFQIYYELVGLFRGRDELNDANIHVERAKAYAIDDTHHLSHAMPMQAGIWHQQGWFEDTG